MKYVEENSPDVIFLGETQEKHEKYEPGQPIFGPRFNPGTPKQEC